MTMKRRKKASMDSLARNTAKKRPTAVRCRKKFWAAKWIRNKNPREHQGKCLEILMTNFHILSLTNQASNQTNQRSPVQALTNQTSKTSNQSRLYLFAIAHTRKIQRLAFMQLLSFPNNSQKPIACL